MAIFFLFSARFWAAKKYDTRSRSFNWATKEVIGNRNSDFFKINETANTLKQMRFVTRSKLQCRTRGVIKSPEWKKCVWKNFSCVYYECLPAKWSILHEFRARNSSNKQGYLLIGVAVRFCLLELELTREHRRICREMWLPADEYTDGGQTQTITLEQQQQWRQFATTKG